MSHKEYIRNGDGDVGIIFIHGFLGSPGHFEMFMDAVPQHYSIYNILLHGHGGGVKDFSKTSMEEWKTQVESVFLKMSQQYKEIVVVAHSMGTLFAYTLANKYPDRVKALFLLGTPLKIRVKATAFVNSFKSLFGIISENDDIGKAYARAHGVKLNLKLWEYIGWIPRYIELFTESHSGRKEILNVNVPCYIFQSAKDELVSRKSEGYIQKNKNITLTVLEKSAHFIYDSGDVDILINKFSEILQ